MNKAQSIGDKIVYIGLCILTLGAAYFLRVIISEGIRKAENG